MEKRVDQNWRRSIVSTPHKCMVGNREMGRRGNMIFEDKERGYIWGWVWG